MQHSAPQKQRSLFPSWILAIFFLIGGLAGLLTLDGDWQRFIWICSLAILYAVSLGFWLVFIPGRKNTRWHHIVAIVTHFPLKKTIFPINNGKCDQDYFALQRKPYLTCVCIDRFSAIATRTATGQLHIRRSGFHFLQHGDEIMHVFDLKPSMFVFGPDTKENPFQALERNDGNLTRMNALMRDIEDTKFISADGQVLCPVFAIFLQPRHRDDQEKSERSLGALSAELLRAGQTGLAAEQFESMIGKLAVKSFNSIIGAKPRGTRTTIEGMHAAFHRQSGHGKMDDLLRKMAQSKVEHAILDAYDIKINLLRVWAK